MTTTTTDVVILGGGHNGLVCAFYLARAGLKVTVLERRHVVGGAAVTEEFHPGFRNSTASYTVSLLNPKVIADMDLARHGLRVVERKVSNFLPFDDGRHFLAGEGRTQGELAKFSTRDAERLPEYERRLEVIAAVLRDWILKAPPNMVEGGWMAMLPELLKGASLGKQAAGLDTQGRRDLLDLFAKSA
ncbi:MAG: FAD-dependent oxidoreductase, partial [Brevundimonas sp.]|uniref:phytoene desaturase family protein n=1 Tax=Brevundimonas sp. TaxID=1871086 RepID=UPI0027180B91